MKKLRRLLLGIVLTPIFANVLFLTGLPAAECNLAEGISDERPNQGWKPTEVSVGLRLIDVTGIQDTTQTITADFMVTQEWTDSRMIGLEGCKLKPAELWIPQIDIVNSGRLFSRLQKTVEVFDNGRLRQVQRYSGSLAFVYDAHRFPFDTLEIVITLLSEKYAQEVVVITIDESVTGRNPTTFNIPDWSVSDVKAEIVTKHFEILNHNQ
jgi:hypothetical protein